MSDTDWTNLGHFVQAFATPLVAVGIWMVRQVLVAVQKTNDHLAVQNGRIAKLETSFADHAAEDTRQFAQTQRLVERAIDRGR